MATTINPPSLSHELCRLFSRFVATGNDWRTLKAVGEFNKKYLGGAPEQAGRLRNEGHVVIRKGKRLFVSGREKSLAALR